MWKYCDFEYRVTLYFKSSYPNQDYGYSIKYFRINNLKSFKNVLNI